MEVIGQITYLLFIRRPDDEQTLTENKARTLGEPIECQVFPDGADAKVRPYADYRWSRFKHFGAPDMSAVVGEHVFPFLLVEAKRTRVDALALQMALALLMVMRRVFALTQERLNHARTGADWRERQRRAS